MFIKFLGFLILLLFIVISEHLFHKKTFSREDKTDLPYSWVFFIILVSAPILNNFNIGSFDNQVIGIIGIVLLLVGVWVRMVAMTTLDKYFTLELVTQKDQEIIQNGIYKYIRHPAYLGTITSSLGFGLTQMNVLVIVLISTFMFVVYFIRIRKEEQMMLGVFGEKYQNYLNKTKRLVPFII